MSRAFVKEPDGGGPPEALPPRPVSPHANYVTPAGLRELRQTLAQLQERRARLLAEHQQAAAHDDSSLAEEIALLDRDMRYYALRVESAIVVDPARQERERVRFAATVTARDVRGQRWRFTIVGEDEANLAAGKISYVSPLAQALDGARVGETVRWQRPIGDLDLVVEGIDYSSEV